MAGWCMSPGWSARHGERSAFVACANFHGVNTPAIDNLKLPTHVTEHGAGKRHARWLSQTGGSWRQPVVAGDPGRLQSTASGARPGMPVRPMCRVRELLLCFFLSRADLYQDAGVILSSLRQTSGGGTDSGNLG